MRQPQICLGFMRDLFLRHSPAKSPKTPSFYENFYLMAAFAGFCLFLQSKQVLKWTNESKT